MPSWCQFHQHFMSSFCAKILLPKITNPNCKHVKAAQKTFIRKSCSYNLGEIDSWKAWAQRPSGLIKIMKGTQALHMDNG